MTGPTPGPFTENFLVKVARGQIPGYSHINKYGRNRTVASGASETAWDGSTDYFVMPGFPATAGITRLVSGAGNTQSIEVQGLDANWAQSTEVIALNGATPVILTTPLLRIFRMRVVSNTTPSANVDATDTAGTSVYARIISGDNQTQMAVFTVPANHAAYMVKYYMTLNKASGGGSAEILSKLFAVDNANNYIYHIKHTMGLDGNASSIVEHEFLPYKTLTEKTDIFLNAENTSGTAIGDVSGGFDIILVQDGF